MATVTSKGQTTIPKAIRAHLHLRPGDRLEFVIEQPGRVVVVPATVDAADLAKILPRPSRHLTIEQMKQVIRKRGGHR